MISFNIKWHAQETYHLQILHHILTCHMYQLKYHEVGEMIRSLNHYVSLLFQLLRWSQKL